MPTVDYMDCFPTGPDTIAGKYMRKFWHPVLRAEDLKPGWAKPIRIMGEDFTLFRGESGNPHVVDFRCPHRQSTLSVGWVEDDCIRCRFHGWKFDGSGQCVEQPAEKEAFSEKVRIRSCPTEEYLGLIFVYFGEGEAPSLPRYPDFEKEGLWVETYVRPCNFLNNIENDPVHIPFTHKESEFFLRTAAGNSVGCARRNRMGPDADDLDDHWANSVFTLRHAEYSRLQGIRSRPPRLARAHRR